MSRFFSDPIVWIIIIVAVLTFFVWNKARHIANKLEDDLHIVYRTANPSVDKKPQPPSPEEKSRYEDTIRKEQKSMNKYYILFANLTACFPLLGMFGTVFSLWGLANNLEDSGISVALFFSALDTTIVGIVCAIISKVVGDSSLAPKVEDNNRELEMYFERNTQQLYQNSETNNQEVKKS